MPKSSSVGKAYVRGAIGCAVSSAALYGIGRWLGIESTVKIATGAQIAVYLLHGLPNKSEKFYDLSGSFTHLSVVLAALFQRRMVRSPRQLFLAITSCLWMTRLGAFLYNRILRDGRDSRFDKFKITWISFLSPWIIQALWVTLIQLPVVLANSAEDPASETDAVDYGSMALWFFGFLIEAAADSEKYAFRNVPENKDKFITTGLWRYSRHPNYFGEIVMWCAQAMIASNMALKGGDSNLHASWISPAFTALLLLKVSGMPMVEKAGQKKWGKDPEYIHYVTRTSSLVPWFPAPLFSKKGK